MITIIHGDKGGVGKSFFCNFYIDYIKSKGKNIKIIDCDTQNPDISWTFKDDEIAQIDIKNHVGWLDLADTIFANKDKEIVISLPGGSGYFLTQEQDFFKGILDKLSLKIIMYFVIDRQKTSLLLLKKAMELLTHISNNDNNDNNKDYSNLIVVKNGFFGPDYYRYDNSKLSKKINDGNGQVMYIEELHSRVIDAIERTPLSDMLADDNLNFGNKIELERWLHINQDTLSQIISNVSK